MSPIYHYLPARSGQTRNLVYLLHVFGSSGTAMLGLGKTLSIMLSDTAFLTPDAPDNVPGRQVGRMWYTIPELDGSNVAEAERRLLSSARELDAFLDDHFARHSPSGSAVALMGFSQGGGLAHEVGPCRRNQLAGIVAIASRMARQNALAADVRSRPLILILTGANDTLMAIDEASQTMSALSKAGISATRITMEGIGHGTSAEGINAAGKFLHDAMRQEGKT